MFLFHYKRTCEMNARTPVHKIYLSIQEKDQPLTLGVVDLFPVFLQEMKKDELKFLGCV